MTPKRGRPPLTDRDRLSASVHIRLSVKTYDALLTQARQERRTVTAIIRDRVFPVPKIDRDSQ